VRWGLSLIETLAATALLAALTAAVVPLFAEARLRLEHAAPDVGLFELGEVADAALRDPESMGLAPDWRDAIRAGPLTARPESGGPVRVRIAAMRDLDAWIAFEREGVGVARFVVLEPAP
jgi:hypothetical protein